MADSQQTKSTSKQESQETGYNSPCGNFEEMLHIMQNFCGDSEGFFDCGAMAQKIFGGMPKDTDGQ